MTISDATTIGFPIVCRFCQLFGEWTITIIYELPAEKRFLYDVKSYQSDNPYLYKMCSDHIIR